MKKKLIILFFIFTFLLSSGFGCSKIDKKSLRYTRPVTLKYWRVWDGPDAFTDLIAQYRRQHPFVKIEYRKLRYDEYENELIEAFAADRGPDIFSIHNTWTQKYQSKNLIGPMPESISMAYPIVKGSLKKEVVIELRAQKSITLKNIKDDFLDTVYNDVVIRAKDEKDQMREQIFGLPLSIDTLVLFYNKDLFNNAGITMPPEYWNREFQQNIKKLTKQNNQGEIIQSGIALGGSSNIERSTDILSVLMMQNGTVMMDSGQVKFHQRPPEFKDRSYNPGLDALRFYVDFSNPAKEVYSWNKNLDNALDMFIAGKLAMMLGYSYMIPQIKARAPKLNFSIASLPQIEGNPQKVNYANYWVETVSRNIFTDPDNLKKGQDYARQKYNTAWDFVQFITRAKQAKIYLDKANKTTALRSLVDEQLEDEDIGIFAGQVLTAKSWYKGNDSNAAEDIIKDMIDKTVSGQDDPIKILNLTARKVQQTVN